MKETDKTELVRRYLKAMTEASDRVIASIVGCKLEEVAVVRREMYCSGELPRHEGDALE